MTVKSLYRPFTFNNLHNDKSYVWSRYQMPRIFPNASSENRVLMVKGNWHGQGQIALMSQNIPCDPSDGGAQCFPRYLYDSEAKPAADDPQGGLFATAHSAPAGGRRDAITDEGWRIFRPPIRGGHHQR
jgi:predicted helicase